MIGGHVVGAARQITRPPSALVSLLSAQASTVQGFLDQRRFAAGLAVLELAGDGCRLSAGGWPAAAAKERDLEQAHYKLCALPNGNQVAKAPQLSIPPLLIARREDLSSNQPPLTYPCALSLS